MTIARAFTGVDARLASSLLLAIGLTCALGCTRESHRVDLVEVPTPNGGAVSAMTRLRTGGDSTLVAATPSDLYLRPEGDDRWTKRHVEWPEAIRAPGRSPTAGLSPPASSFNFSTATRLATHRHRLWMLTRPRSDRGPVLMVGSNGGRDWTLAPLPPFYERRSPTSDRGGSQPGSALARIDTRTPLRLADYGSERLFLLDGHRIWRAEFSDADRAELKRWVPVDLAGLDPHTLSMGEHFPSVIRNYLPATDARPYELITVFGERLYIYRRSEKASRWVLVSTLPDLDRRLFGYPGTDLVYLLSPETLYRTTERGERWEGLPLSRALTRSEITTAAFLDDGRETSDAPSGRPGLPTVLLGTDTGSIYRSRYERDDGAEDVWASVRGPDPDGRAITSLVPPAEEAGAVWASTAGSGTLRSIDGGQSWSKASRGLRATRPLDLAIGTKGALLLGTEAGLFRLTGAPEEGHWSFLHGRATSAIAQGRTNARLFSGTFGGGIVSEAAGRAVAPGRRSERSADLPPPLMQPWSAPKFALPPSAVLSIQERPNSEEMFAWSHQTGLLTSSDAGVSWWYAQLNPGLRSTLETSLITNAVVDRGERMYLTSHPLGAEADRARLWRSTNDGKTWHSIHVFRDLPAESPLLLRRAPRDDTGALYASYGSHVMRSTDAGVSWRSLEGPWRRGRIYAHEVEASSQTLVYNTHHASYIALLSELDRRPPTSHTYRLDWPDSAEIRHPNVRHVARHQQFVYLTTPGRLFAGTIPEGRVQIPHAPTILVTLFFMLALTGVSFWYLRSW